MAGVPGGVLAQDSASTVYQGKTVQEWSAVLKDNLERNTPEAKEACRKSSQAIGQFGQSALPAVPLLSKALESPSPEAREYAVDALGRIGPQAKAAVPAIVAGLSLPKSDESYELLSNFRRLAAKALGRIGPEAQAAVPILKQALQDDDAVYRVAAALALWRIGRAPEALPALQAVLESKGLDGPYQAAMALLEIGPEAKPAIPLLVSCLRREEADVRRAAAKVLAAFGPVVLVPVAQALTEPGNDHPEPAAYVLGEVLAQLRQQAVYNPQLAQAQFTTDVEPAMKWASPALGGLLLHPREEVRQDAIRALAQMGWPALPLLLKALDSENAAVRAAAIEVLVRIEQDLPPRESPVNAGLQQIKQDAVPPLLKLLKHADPKVRESVCRVLAEFGLGAVAQDAEPQLRELLKDQDVAVRRYASKALEQFRDKPQEEER